MFLYSSFITRIFLPVLFFLFIQSASFAADTLFTKQGPYKIFQQEILLPVQDGTKLWACFTFPVKQRKKEKFPAILIMDPYAGDCTLDRYDEGFLASNGYVVCMFHVRGSGRSEGVLFDREYSEQELKDAVYLIDWLAKQKWCSGKTGMYGGSWSAFNSSQVAMQKPPSLKAIICYVGTEDLYNEDVHYADGIFRFDDYDMLADMNFATVSPPDNPLDEKYFQNRFDQPPLSLLYLKHQRDGDFWRKDIRLNIHPDTLQVPVYMIGGWYDGYRTAIPRALQYLKTPAKAIIGPWDHSTAFPEPAADLTKNVLRWWDKFLKNKPTGVMNDPSLLAYMRKPYMPVPGQDTIPGYWQRFAQWPPANLKDSLLYLSPNHQLINTPSKIPIGEQLKYVPSGGSHAGIWWGDVMPDQRPTDMFSLIYETPVFDYSSAMIGQPVAKLFASANAKQANWMVRLSDVAPDGTVTLITGAALNGTHRSSAENPSYLVPGQVYPLHINLHFTSWVIEKGHKIRVAVSNGLWPMFWPTPYPMRTALQLGGDMASSVTLPIVPLADITEQNAAAAFAGSNNISSRQNDVYLKRDTGNLHNWIGPVDLQRNETSGKSTMRYSIVYSTENTTDTIIVTYTVFDDNPAGASVNASEKCTKQINGHTAVWTGNTVISGDVINFFYRHSRTLVYDGKLIRQKEWKETIQRDFQ
jgi:uncharacterized protein